VRTGAVEGPLRRHGQRIKQPREEVTKRKRREDEDQQDQKRELDCIGFRFAIDLAGHGGDEDESERVP